MLITVNRGGWRISDKTFYQTETSVCLDLMCGEPTCNQGGIVVLCYRLAQLAEYSETETGCTLRASGGEYGGGSENLVTDEYVVRRLTPTECARLQGMPDWWCEDVPHADSAEYKMWGNGMALPNCLYIIENIVRVLGK